MGGYSYICEDIGDSYFDKKNYTQADFYYKKACEKLDYGLRRIESGMDNCEFIADRYRAIGDYKRAEYYKNESASYTNEKAYDYLDKKDYAQAEFYFKKACLKDEEFCNYEAKINQAKGNDYFAKKDYKQAKIYHNKACEKDKDGGICAEIGDYLNDVYYYEKAIEKNQAYIVKYTQKGREFFEKEDYKQAEFYLKQACEKEKEKKKKDYFGDYCEDYNRYGVGMYLLRDMYGHIY